MLDGSAQQELLDRTVQSVVAEVPPAGDVLRGHHIDPQAYAGHTLRDAASQEAVSITMLLKDLAEAAGQHSAQADADVQFLLEMAKHVDCGFHRKFYGDFSRLLAQIDEVGASSQSAYVRLSKVKDVLFNWAIHVQLHISVYRQMILPVLRKLKSAADVANLPDSYVNKVGQLMEEANVSADLEFKKLRELTSDFQSPSNVPADYQAILENIKALEAYFHKHRNIDLNFLHRVLTSVRTERQIIEQTSLLTPTPLCSYMQACSYEWMRADDARHNQQPSSRAKVLVVVILLVALGLGAMGVISLIALYEQLDWYAFNSRSKTGQERESPGKIPGIVYPLLEQNFRQWTRYRKD